MAHHRTSSSFALGALAGSAAALAACGVAWALARSRVKDRGATPSAKQTSASSSKRRHEGWLSCERIIVAATEREYRRLVQLIAPTDCCIELGCHEGVTTHMAAARGCPFVLGVDTSAHNIEKANTSLTEVWRGSNRKGGPKAGGTDFGGALRFLQGDASDIRAVRGAIPDDMISSGRISVILVDVSGSRDPKFLLELIETYDKVFKPSLFIIKSFKLEKLSQVLEPAFLAAS